MPYHQNFSRTQSDGPLEKLLECPEQQQMNRYINANYINRLIGGASEKSVIACQAPVEKSLSKFWQMVWENQV